MSRPILHYHKCRCCDQDCTCLTVDCPFRATAQETEFICFHCQENGKKLIEQFKTQETRA